MSYPCWEMTQMAKGKFKSERQRRFMWSQVPAAARKWAHNLNTRRADWRGAKVSRSVRRGRRRG